MGRIGLIISILALSSLSFAQPGGVPGGGPPGQRTGVEVENSGTRAGIADTLNFANGGATCTGSECTIEMVVDAREKLHCDGVTDDRATFKSLVENGGEWAGKTIDFSQCTMLWSSCASDSSSCTVVRVEPGARLIGRPGSRPNVTLARRYCAGGSTPGASCNENGPSDCGTGTCTYDCPSGGSCGTTDLAFAHTGAATYTLFKGPENSACTGVGTPWPCCYASGAGKCDVINQNIEFKDFTIATNQLEDYGRCTNGGAENGDACRGYCSDDSEWANWSCSDAAGCNNTGTCVNSALCPGASSQCDGASRSPSGSGSIVIIDASGTAGVTVDGMIVTDHLKGAGISVGPRGTVRRTNLVAPSGFTWTQPYFGLVNYYPSNVSYAVTTGISTGASSTVEDNTVRGTVKGIGVSAADSQSGVGSPYLTRPSKITGNEVVVVGTSAEGISTEAPNSNVSNNRVYATGDFAFGIRVGYGAARSTVDGNYVSVGASGNTDGLGVQIAANLTTATGNIVNMLQTTKATGVRVGSTGLGTACGAGTFPDCTDGGTSSIIGGNVNLASGNGNIGVELMGVQSRLVGINIQGATATTDTQGVALGQNSQMVISAADIYGTSNAVGPVNRKYCVGGSNAGKICKYGSTSAATCTDGTCTFDDFASNYTIDGVRAMFQNGVGLYLLTGALVGNTYVAWQSGSAGVMLGDDRVNVGKLTTHAAINGGLVHAFPSGIPLIKYAPMAVGLCQTGTSNPWPCCTGSGAGATCGTTISTVNISGVDLLGATLSNMIGVDLSTSYGANSPLIEKVSVVGNLCEFSGSSTTCIALPSTAQNRVTGLLLSSNNSFATTNVSNWDPSMGYSDINGVIADFSAAGCVNSVAYPFWDLPATNPAVANCISNTNYTPGHGVLDFSDTSGGTAGAGPTLSAFTNFILPHRWSGNLYVDVYWGNSSTTSGSVMWQVKGVCVASGEGEDPSFSSSASTAAGTVNTTNAYDVTKTTITLSSATNFPLNTCAADEVFHMQLYRDPTNVSDTTVSTTASVYRVVVRQ